jgi:hypothetical protein
MRAFLSTSFAAALVGVLLTATPAGAVTSGISVSPESGPAGTTITVASTTPCPAAPAGTTLTSVEVAVLNLPGTDAVGTATATPAADGSFTTPVTIAGDARNGEYAVVAACVAGDQAYAFDVAGYVVTSPTGQADPAVRLAGTDRLLTAIQVSRDLYPNGDAGSVVLGRFDQYYDALAGTPLARFEDGPLLLTPSDSLYPATAAEIGRVLGGTGDVYLLGGTAAISDNVANQLRSSGYNVIRLAGTDRFDTAAQIANHIGPDTVLLATGLDFHDGLVAGAAADAAGTDRTAAVLLTAGTTMPPSTSAYLSAHPSLTRYAVGSPAKAADAGATAIAGATDPETSRLVAERFFPSPLSIAAASNAVFPDSLAGGVHASAFGAPLLYVDGNALPSTISGYLASVRGSVVVAFVYGGTGAISDSVRSAISQAIS